MTAGLRSLVLIGIAGLAVSATTVSPALGGSAGAGDVFGGWPAPLVTTLAVVVNCVVFITVFQISLASEPSVRDVAPGAVAAAVNLADAARVRNRRRVEHREGLERHLTECLHSFRVGWACLFPAALGVVVSAEINVVRTSTCFHGRFSPGSPTPVDLTHADQRAYTDAATAQQHKGFLVTTQRTALVTSDHEDRHPDREQRHRGDARAERGRANHSNRPKQQRHRRAAVTPEGQRGAKCRDGKRDDEHRPQAAIAREEGRADRAGQRQRCRQAQPALGREPGRDEPAEG